MVSMEDVNVTAPRCWTGRHSRSVLEIRADGRFRVERLEDCGSTYESVLSKGELDALLQDIVVEQQFMSLTAPGIWDDIHEERRKRNEIGGLFRVIEAGDTIVHVKTANRENKVMFNAPSRFAQENPGAKQIVRLASVVEKLRILASRLAETGRAHATVALGKANQHLARTYPALPKLGEFLLDHVRSFSSQSGQWSSEFRHVYQDDRFPLDDRYLALRVTVVDPMSPKPEIVVTTQNAD
jgi:hypothetical protein